MITLDELIAEFDQEEAEFVRRYLLAVEGSKVRTGYNAKAARRRSKK